MKKLSDYTGDEAIELWADMLEPINNILADTRVAETVKSGKSKMMIAKEILKTHPAEARAILQRIDPAPIDGLNIILRLVAVLSDIGANDEIKSFFGYAEQQEQISEEYGGSPTESTEVGEN